MPSADQPSLLDLALAGENRGDGAAPLLVAEAIRELTICNSCRYCEGFCAVFPALTRRATVDSGDVAQLANLCHDCRACYDACMYSPPHEYELNLPKALSAVRLTDYDRYIWPRRVPAALSGAMGVVAGAVTATLLVVLLAVIHVGWSGIVATTSRAASPYRLIPYDELLACMLAAVLYSIAVILIAAGRYWDDVRGIHGSLARAITQAMWDAVTLRYMRGGGDGCYYPDDETPSTWRRHLHGLVAGGFGLCALSTVAAAVTQDIVGTEPPYPWLSVPVICGAAGGIGLLLGAVGLLRLKTQASHVTSFSQMTVKDYGLLVALAFLALSGLAVLLTRDTAAFGIVLLIHLSAVLEAMAMAPYSKLAHVVFRFLALVQDSLERQGP